jgi:hypothetical protein
MPAEGDSIETDSIMSKYVAWGSIKTPFGNYNNVILVEDYIFDQSSNTWEIDYYKWISVSTMMNVLEYYPSDSSGSWFVHNIALTSSQNLLQDTYKFDIYPNPATNQSTISFTLTNEADVTVQLIAVDGSMMNTLVANKRNAGKHILPVSTETLAAGTYFVRMVIDNQPIVKTITVVK